MAITTVIEKGSGDENSFSLPVFVYDPAGGTVSRAAAISAAESAAPTTIFAFGQDGVPTIEDLVENVYRVTIKYTQGDYSTWSTQERFDFAANAQAWVGNYAPQVARFPGTAFDYDGVVAPNGRPGGMQPAPPRDVGKSFRLPLGSLNATNVRFCARAAKLGAVHNATYGAYNQGELAIVHFSMQQVDAYNVQVNVGWSYNLNVTGENRGGITGVAYKGHEYVWEVQDLEADRVNNILGITNKAVYVSAVRPVVDILTPLGVNPP